MSTDLFPGFVQDRITVTHSHAEGLELNVRIGGSGRPLLLIHGYPQTGAMWHKLAPVLAENFTVVVPDLRGYGASDKPPTDPQHLPYSKRAMAADMAALMAGLGHKTFQVAGHDRGGRVTHRLCLDHPDAVERAAVLDIVPTHTLFNTATHAVAHAYYHWYFLAQAAPLPETLIGADPDFYLNRKFGGWSAGETGFFDPRAMAEYKAAYGWPETIHATCEDYRAAATIDLEHDTADLDRRVGCPFLVLWGAKAPMHANYDVLDTWRNKAVDPTGHAVEAGHFLAEENPEQTLAAFNGHFVP
ncbi:alpha/beta fold hydrolase [Pacificispira sp.]|uniref:alpha/beta fold hydrolase n=1 Tax=Pacificispira sp. TaxID=2888761 RepID=UPI003BAB9A7D